MKKIAFKALVAALAFGGLSQGALAVQTTICVASPQAHAANENPPAGVAGTHYMLTQIFPKCSANVTLIGADGANAAWYAVTANSSKGTKTYGASTGGFQGNSSCAIPGGCTAGEATGYMTTANTGT